MEEIDIKDFFEYFKKYTIIIVLVVAIGFILTVVYDKGFKVPMYKTYTTIVLTQTNTNTETTITQNDITLNQKLVSTYREIIKSKLVLEQVINEIGSDLTIKELSKNISVEALQDTEILKISVKDANAKRATKIANSIANIFSKEVTKIYQINNTSVIDVAQVPKEVDNNTLLRDIFLSMVATLFGSMAVIFIIYYFDDSIKLSEKLEEEIGMPILAKVFESDVKQSDKYSKVELILSKYPKALVSESIKTLRTNLQFSAVDSQLKTILVTSSIPGEGKSFISANLAISFTQTGKRVLIVDCDMRKGRQHRIFRMSNSKGLSNLLIDDINNISDYINKTSVKHLYLITRGACPPNPIELLNSKKNKELVKLLKSKFDIVIFDGVPCNGLSDSIIMSTLVDRVLVVSSETVTPKSVLKSTKDQLEKVNAPVSGLIVNNIKKKGSSYGKYYSYYGGKDN